MFIDWNFDRGHHKNIDKQTKQKTKFTILLRWHAENLTGGAK